MMVDSSQPLPDSQWQVMCCLLPVQRKRQLCVRRVVDAVFYLCRTGCQWRKLPAEYPPWTAVYYYFYRWQRTGLCQQLNTVINALAMPWIGSRKAGKPARRCCAPTASACAWARASTSTGARTGAST